jgi:glycosyltransferase involved in cell wall biosynthesis
MKRYFESLENQSYKEFEVIIIDDCSSDGSYENVKKYSENCSLDIKVFKTPSNMGPGYARNMGLDAANGEWITFIDNDDWVEYNWLEQINNVITTNSNIDCLIYDYYMKSDSNCRIMRSILKGQRGILQKSDVLTYVTNHTVGKFYKLENCNKNNVRFLYTRRCEDVAFTYLAVAASNTIYYLDEPYYYYFQRKHSLSNNTNLDERDMINAYSEIKQRLGNKYSKEIAEKSVRDLLYGVVLMMCKAKKGGQEIKKYIQSYEVTFPNWYKMESISYLGRPKRVFLKLVKNKNIFGLRILSWIHNKLIG